MIRRIWQSSFWATKIGRFIAAFAITFTFLYLAYAIEGKW